MYGVYCTGILHCPVCTSTNYISKQKILHRKRSPGTDRSTGPFPNPCFSVYIAEFMKKFEVGQAVTEGVSRRMTEHKTLEVHIMSATSILLSLVFPVQERCTCVRRRKKKRTQSVAHGDRATTHRPSPPGSMHPKVVKIEEKKIRYYT